MKNHKDDPNNGRYVPMTASELHGYAEVDEDGFIVEEDDESEE